MKLTTALQKVYDHRKMMQGEKQRITCHLNSCQVFLYSRRTRKGVVFFALGYKGRSKKTYFHRNFGNDESNRNSYVSEFMNRCKTEQIEKERTPGRALEVGNVLSCSWGYDQTNVDYYLVTELIGKTQVMIVKIGQQLIESSNMTGKCIPDIQVHIGEPMRKSVAGDHVKINSYSWAYLKKSEKVAGVEIFSPDNYTSYA